MLADILLILYIVFLIAYIYLIFGKKYNYEYWIGKILEVMKRNAKDD